MIGVIAEPSEHGVVSEFFELFKTPWEFFRKDRKYDVLLCASDESFDDSAAPVVLIFAGNPLSSDTSRGIRAASALQAPGDLAFRGNRIPIYEGRLTFAASEHSLLTDQESGLPAIQLIRTGKATVARLGYNLFREIRALLTTGQPVANASVPALELHIALLRDLIAAAGAPLPEIPPVPAGYRFIACLTHDVDHPLVRNHRFDHTTFGFLYRATLGSLRDVVRARRGISDAWRSLVAAAKLPLVYLGLAKDFWGDFDRYPEIENGAGSSFFVIPFRDRPGQKPPGQAPKARAARYGAADITAQIRKLQAAGCEIGTHGIDAWVDRSAGREELGEIRRLTGAGDIGVRMHWLYFDERSHETLEAAGADYDSTVGYNGTVGYRAGTTQVYKPLGTTHLLELPLHIMDTALFYPAHLNLTARQASARVREIIEHAVQLGGCVTVNWHDRSIAPERCWDGFYRDLLEELKNQGAWFATAAQAVAWFRKRRLARWESTGELADKEALAAGGDGVPGLQVTTLNPRPDHVLSGV